jgi:chromosome segregation ATPase
MRLERDNVEIKKWFHSAQADIERLENENHKFQADANNDSRNIQECQQKLKDSEKNMRALQVECDNMKKELREAIEEESGANGVSNFLGFLTPGSSKDKVKSIIKSRQQLEASQAECERLVSRCRNLETQIAQHQREQEFTVKSLEDELVARREQVQELKAQLIQKNQQANECIQKMRAENESLQKEVKETLTVLQEEVNGKVHVQLFYSTNVESFSMFLYYTECTHKREQQQDKETPTKEGDQLADDGEGCNRRHQRNQEALMQARQPHAPPVSPLSLPLSSSRALLPCQAKLTRGEAYRD